MVVDTFICARTIEVVETLFALIAGSTDLAAGATFVGVGIREVALDT